MMAARASLISSSRFRADYLTRRYKSGSQRCELQEKREQKHCIAIFALDGFGLGPAAFLKTKRNRIRGVGEMCVGFRGLQRKAPPGRG
jgi:hypothetical protein